MDPRLRLFACLFSLAVWLDVAPACGKVLWRITGGELPPAKDLGASDVVLQWPVRDAAIAAKLRELGFRVLLETSRDHLVAAANAAERAHLTGVIVDSAALDASGNNEKFRSTQAAHPKLLFRVLISGGKQPQMRGRLVVDRDGILQVSSPSSQPWLDTNLAAVRLAEMHQRDHEPVLYDFHWDLSGAVQKEKGPSVEQYALAISESAAIGADVIIDVPEPLRVGLVANEPESWKLWNQIKQYIAFSPVNVTVRGMRPIANMGIVTCDEKADFEALNLLARHNLTFNVVRPEDLNAERLNRWNVLLVLCAASNAGNSLLNDFAKDGGLVVMVNQSGEQPWHSTPPVRQDQHAATCNVGSGQVVELKEPVTDPEIFARDLRRLIGAERPALGLWNSLTTLVTAYQQETTGETILHAINYADVPDTVQIQMKGRFTSVQLESPQTGCCSTLPSVQRGAFTEFTIPRLVIAARVHLKPSGAVPAAR